MERRRLTVLFSGQSDAIRWNFRSCFERKGIDTYFATRDGNEIVQAVQRIQPQVVVLDAFLKGSDAIRVKRQCEQLDCCPQLFLAMESCDNEMLETMLLDAGFAHCFSKPVSAEYMIEIIGRMTGETAYTFEDILEQRVCETLHMLGVPAHMKGYNLLRQGIIETVQNPDAITLITKRMYPHLAQINNSTANRVERAMRHAISTAWDNGNNEEMCDYFGYAVNNISGKPTNREFIAIVGERIRFASQNRKIR
ncbi:MAG: sporulation transcription factor Spo0A [Oscillospiraceae bacterium]|nr:sporulation transcription factor Spo0A [Oscillospiraceae bacterium]